MLATLPPPPPAALLLPAPESRDGRGAVDSSGQQQLGSGEADTDTDCYKCMRGLRGYDQCHNAAHVAEFDLISLLLHGVWYLQNLPLYPHFVSYLMQPIKCRLVAEEVSLL